MTIEQQVASAIDELQRTFGAQAESSVAGSRKIVVASGGPVDKVDDPALALCLSRETAVAVWLHSMHEALLQSAPGWRITEGPHIDRWNITVEDGMNVQRIAQPRYSVCAAVEVIDLPKEATPVDIPTT